MKNQLVEKYQYYFNESVKLQETVNIQNAYIAELEEALIATIDEMGGIEQIDERVRKDTRSPLAKVLNMIGLRSPGQKAEMARKDAIAKGKAKEYQEMQARRRGEKPKSALEILQSKADKDGKVTKDA